MATAWSQGMDRLRTKLRQVIRGQNEIGCLMGSITPKGKKCLVGSVGVPGRFLDYRELFSMQFCMFAGDLSPAQGQDMAGIAFNALSCQTIVGSALAVFPRRRRELSTLQYWLVALGSWYSRDATVSLCSRGAAPSLVFV